MEQMMTKVDNIRLRFFKISGKRGPRYTTKWHMIKRAILNGASVSAFVHSDDENWETLRIIHINTSNKIFYTEDSKMYNISGTDSPIKCKDVKLFCNEEYYSLKRLSTYELFDIEQAINQGKFAFYAIIHEKGNKTVQTRKIVKLVALDKFFITNDFEIVKW